MDLERQMPSGKSSCIGLKRQPQGLTGYCDLTRYDVTVAEAGAATRQFIASIQQGNSGMKATTGVDEMRVNQREARSVEFQNQGASAGGGMEYDWLVTAARDDGS
ncbi:hypothetical protein H7849_16555 [Alloacidobacterium dinghuense]|uniref:Uncharacterized protein n=1 Tax=Alloacidobacterium dinghuense TaxID=2763107 RepID=A0A7G8BDV7_9BACT|nr:hypothetical protein [Alloacidobacterium dinghuense]QNI30727.1 hypothetical protein H7849_16555 [Alloacidobacterium dinghuense]